ncbi:hypothetical protein SEA_VORVOLAKOS_84 [Streptomyces phage Vorvolakos]|uniref:Uncharacterized protein n=3 Tax=Flowerpowervirus flowerpower TaxID=2846396 RepID=A0A2U8UN44_9CAUD|nr:hypothetical protein HWB61_gp18 [Streptomyces phage FlowerPower]QEA11285.1 hypothetical protein SEA_GEOSTIN_78 [Streptomyces phage Geostin]QFP94783.1 hypothetical protein SEA_FABIAN_82 [Streptomyces phage Fabian]QZD97129.1 hypothetical protein SEA_RETRIEVERFEVER_83 [Streptomyces phage RetrieverFever]UOW93294.1 hypothetical protein SEA_VORVOLAKOS_84 [Streptomyces phage Vorvolakos]AWN05164.1 hypothetical protein SEA_FLOWERPOWER_83 [Streptomyces phage FlowerPower]
MTDYAAKVAAGIKFLDGKAASGALSANWRDKIDLDELSLESCDVCVLGQLFGGYETGKYTLNIDSYDAKAFGFNTDYSFNELTAAWKDALGQNGKLVEKGEVYKDNYGYAVKVIQTHIITVDNVTTTVYLVQAGSLSGNVFKAYSGNEVTALQKIDFEQTYKTKVEKFVPKKGMFVTATSSGRNFYVCSDEEVRELKDGAYATWISDLSKAERDSLKEMVTGVGKKFSETVVK